MSPNTPSINATTFRIRHARYSLSSAPCDRCGLRARRVWEASRTAIDLDLENPVLLLVTVSVHHCRSCSHHFRIQPPFLRNNAVYTERVVSKAVHSVYEDGMAFRRVGRRLARDFWVTPSEAMIRRWCGRYADGVDFEGDYQKWVVEEFSGVLCVDEVYQDKLALLLAVDPATPDGDHLVGYQLIHGRVERKDVEKFLLRLRQAGVDPEEVITDGSPLYPGALKEVWPTAAHQLCLFHETRLVTGEIYKAMAALRKKSVPKPPPVSAPMSLKGLPRKCPLPEKLAAHRAAITRVFALYEQGVSIRGIRRQTGHSRNTIKRWLRGEIPNSIAKGQLPSEWILAEIAGEEEPEGEHTSRPPTTTTPEVPSPWNSWEQVREVRNLLWDCRYVVLSRPDHLTAEDREKLDLLFESPVVGEQVRLVRSFLEEWYLLFHDEQGERRTLPQAKERWERLKNDPSYRTLKHLAHLQARVDEEHFLKICRFLEQDHWESTNNGAERMGRAFRHLQKPRYNFRTSESIRRVIEVGACISKAEKLGKEEVVPGRCARGRKPRRWCSGAPVTV